MYIYIYIYIYTFRSAAARPPLRIRHRLNGYLSPTDT